MASIHEKTSAMYDAIDNREIDKAIKIGERPELRAYALPQALLAYCYASKRRLQEALDTSRLVIQMRPTDEGALNAISYALGLCRKEDELIAFYESLVAVYPQNAGYMLKLFSFYIKQDDGKKMQMVAQKLYKLEGHRKYLFWTVGSMLQQPDLAPMMLSVAEKMMHKLFYVEAGAPATAPAPVPGKAAKPTATKTISADTTLQPGSEEIEMYIEVLRRQGKHTEALAALRDLYARPCGPPINDGDAFQADGASVKMHALRFHSLCADILSVMAGTTVVASAVPAEAKPLPLPTDGVTSISQLKEVHRMILSLYPDQWTSHKALISLEVHGSLSQTSSTCSVEALAAYRLYILDIHARHPVLRGPLLAEILLLCTWGEASGQPLPVAWTWSEFPQGYARDATISVSSEEPTPGCGLLSQTVSEELGTLICRYVQRFQSKQCCFSDIKQYLHKLGTTRGKKVLESIATWAVAQQRTLQTSINALSGGGQTDLSDEVAITESAEAGDEQADTSATSSLITENATKKSKNKKKKKAAKASEGKATEESRGLAVNLLCSYAKMGQVRTYAALLSSGSALAVDTPIEELQIQSLEFFEKTRPLCAGSIGGEKEVQPGDEILLLASAQHRCRNQQSIGDSVSASTHDTIQFLSACRWCYLLITGVQASPYSYALKLDMFTPLRTLACADTYWSFFQDLKVRHVQFDSLSYLVLPALYEAGMFTEARRQHLQVLAFHRGAVGEIAEMMAEAFQHANYTKCLEMKKFLRRCASSLQLALTNTEFPLVEIIDGKGGRLSVGNCADVAKYLEDYVNNDAMPLFSDQQLASLSDNNDYSLLIRCDSSDKQEDDDARTRTEQYSRRIKVGQLSLRMLSAAINAEPDKADDYLRQLMLVVHRKDCAAQVVSTAATASEVADAARVSSRSGDLPWSQSINMGGEDFESAMWLAVEKIVTFSTAAARALQKSLAVSEGEAKPSLETGSDKSDPARAQMEYISALQTYSNVAVQLAPECVSAIQAVQAFLTAGERHIPTPATGAGADSKATEEIAYSPLSPTWIQRASFYCRTLAPWTTYLLKAALDSLPKDPAVGRSSHLAASSKNGGGSSSSSSSSGSSSSSSSSRSRAATNDVGAGVVADAGTSAVLESIRDQLQSVYVAAYQVMEANSILINTMQSFLAKQLDQMALSGSASPLSFLNAHDNLGSGAWGKAPIAARTDLAKRLVSSQQVTANRLSGLLQCLQEMITNG